LQPAAPLGSALVVRLRGNGAGVQVQVNGMRPPRWACSAALVAIVALSGCGSSSKSSTQTAGTQASAPLTHAEYIAEAEAVCAALEKTGLRLSTTKSPFAQKVKEAIGARRATNELLRKIPASPAEKFASRWLHYREAAVDATQIASETKPGSDSNKLAGEREYEATEKARAIAKAAGLPTCARVI
jgi:hypothetical protein